MGDAGCGSGVENFRISRRAMGRFQVNRRLA